MKKITIKIFFTIITLVAAIMLSANIAIWAFQDKIKQEVAEQVALNTPVKLAINGDISWLFIKPLTLSVSQVSISNQEQLLTDIAHIDISIGINSLWQDAIYIQNIEIIIDQILWHTDTLQTLMDNQKPAAQTEPKPDPKPEPSNSKLAIVIQNINFQIKKLSATQGDAQISIDELSYQSKNTAINTSLNQVLPIQEHQGQLSVKAASLNDLGLQQLVLDTTIKNNNIQAKFSTMFANGNITSNMSAELAHDIKLTLKQLKLENFSIEQALLDSIEKLQKLDLKLPTSEQKQVTTKTEKDDKSFAVSDLYIEDILLKNINIELQKPNKISLKQANLEFSQQAIFSDKKLLIKPPTKALTFKLNADFKTLKIDEQSINEFNLQATADKHDVLIKNLALEIFDGKIQSIGNIDASIASLPAKLSTTAKNLNIAALTSKTDYPGEGDLFTNIESQLLLLPEKPSDKTYIANSNNSIHIYSQDTIKVSNIDIDKLINSLQESANISWMDIGAVGLFGPVGLLYSTAVSVGSNNIKKDPGESIIDKVDLNITNTGSLISIKNNLISTEKNNISALGEIDYSNESFKDFKIAFLDKKYCPTFIQQVSGTFEKPKIAASNLAKGLLFNTVGGLFSTKKLTGERCNDFYNGKLEK